MFLVLIITKFQKLKRKYMRTKRILSITQTLLKTFSTKSYNLFVNTILLQKHIKRIFILEQYLFKSE